MFDFISGGVLGLVGSVASSAIKGVKEHKNNKLQLEITKLENEHEKQMLQLSSKVNKERDDARINELEIRNEGIVSQAEAEIVKSQMQSLYSDSKKLNSITASVRPITTYAFNLVFLSLYMIYGVYFLFFSDTPNSSVAGFLNTDFSKVMINLYQAILVFWFGNRTIEKTYSRKKR